MTENAKLSDQIARLTDQFKLQFGRRPTHASVAPGRVNIIGEHTDYNDGFVLPMAIERQTLILADLRKDNNVQLASTAFDERANFEISSELGKGEPSWSNYIRGPIAYCLGKGLTPPGFDALLDSTVPTGGGLSSSASLEVAAATLIESMTQQSIDPIEKALLCQKAEHDFAGMPCGIMDQFISTMGQEGAALLIDCRSYETRQVKLNDPSIVVLIINSNKSHQLTGGEYAERRGQCEEAAKSLGVKALRDATVEQLREAKSQLNELAYKRAHHVITENERTLQAADALDDGDYFEVGRLMFQSHISMRDHFQISTPELDLLVELAEGLQGQGVIGSRMTGGGFGGCTVTLAKADCAEAVMSQICTDYQHKTGIEPIPFVTRPAEGARILSV